MLAFARRPEARRGPAAEPGLSAEQFERIVARLRSDRTTYPLASNPKPANRLRFQPVTTTNRGGSR